MKTVAEIGVVLRGVPVELVDLGEIEVPESSSLGNGEAVLVEGHNLGDTTIRRVVVGVEGDGAENVQLSADSDGSPLAWADAGQEILAHADNLKPGASFVFWMQARYTAEDLGHKEFELIFRAVDIG